jgi:hypothetical protein
MSYMSSRAMLIARALILASSMAVLGSGTPAVAADPPRLTVVELFTSQGCSSCPPADAYLGELAQRPDVLALAWHVDYWNYIGWTDPFASKLATQRQRDYARHLNMRYVYTPQMVVDGTAEGVGSEPETIGALIRSAAEEKALRPGLSITRGADGRLEVHVEAGAAEEAATVWLVGFDRLHTTQVLRGENQGQTLKDYHVVRSCEPVGSWLGAALDLSIAADKATGDGGIAVLLQQGGGTGHIIGAALLKPPTS